MKIVNSKKAKSLAEKYCPVFVQDFKSPYDLISEINLAGYITPEEPVIYYAVKQAEESNLYFIYYLVYHYRDYSDLPEPIKSLDEHRNDFEGVMLIIDDTKREIIGGVSRSHYRLKVYDEMGIMPGPISRPWFVIEYGGHGIESIRDNRNNVTCKNNRIIYKQYRLINLYDKKVWKWFNEVVVPEFKKHGVDMPWNWNDTKIRQKYGRKTDGLIWNDPVEFIRLAKKVNLIS